MIDPARLITKLVDLSRRTPIEPHLAIEWPEQLPADQWSMSPELISLCGTPAYDRLSEADRHRLSFLELINFFSISIHGEIMGIEGVVKHLARKEFDLVTPYLHHFVDEENKHMTYFGEFCRRYAGKIYPDRHFALPRNFVEGEQEFRSYASILIFEEVLDHYNVRMSKDERLHPLVRTLNGIHHQEETRHLAFGRWHVKNLFDTFSSRWSVSVLAGVRAYICEYVRATWREYFNIDVYGETGIDDPYAAREAALGSSAGSERRSEAMATLLPYLLETGILLEDPFNP